MFGRKQKSQLDVYNGEGFVVRPGVEVSRGKLFLIRNSGSVERQARDPLLSTSLYYTGNVLLVLGFSMTASGLILGGASAIDGADPVGYFLLAGLSLSVFLLGGAARLVEKRMQRMKAAIFRGKDFILRPFNSHYSAESAVTSGKYGEEMYDLLDKAILAAGGLESTLSHDIQRELVQLRWDIAVVDQDYRVLWSANVDEYSSEDKALRDETLAKLSGASSILLESAAGLIDATNSAVAVDTGSVQSEGRKQMLAMAARAEQLCEPNPDANARVLLDVYSKALKDSESAYLALE